MGNSGISSQNVDTLVQVISGSPQQGSLVKILCHRSKSKEYGHGHDRSVFGDNHHIYSTAFSGLTELYFSSVAMDQA